MSAGRHRGARPKNALSVLTRSLSAYFLAAGMGALLGGAVGLAIFLLPVPFFGIDILLVWGWIGGPLGMGLGYWTFITVAHRSGTRWADQLTHATQDNPTALRQRQHRLDEQIDATIQAAIAAWTKDPARVEHCPACQGPLMVQPSTIGMPTDAPPFYRVSCRCRRCSGTFKAQAPSSSTSPE